MKRLQFIAFSILFLFLLSSCGSSTEKKESKEDSKPAKSEKLDLKTQEGVVKTLKTVDINIPAEFNFEKAELDGGYYKSEFVTDSLDEETFTELSTWVPELVEKKVEAGWKKFDVRKDEEFVGSVINESILYAPKGSEIKGLTVSSAAEKEKMVIKLYFSIDS